jgi:hypothetical protein
MSAAFAARQRRRRAGSSPLLMLASFGLAPAVLTRCAAAPPLRQAAAAEPRRALSAVAAAAAVPAPAPAPAAAAGALTSLLGSAATQTALEVAALNTAMASDNTAATAKDGAAQHAEQTQAQGQDATQNYQLTSQEAGIANEDTRHPKIAPLSAFGPSPPPAKSIGGALRNRNPRNWRRARAFAHLASADAHHRAPQATRG